MSAKLGASFTLLTVRVKVTESLVSTPPLAVPPLSCAVIVTVALPLAFAAGVKVSTPLVLTAGATLNRPGLLFPVTVTVVMLWLDSFAGPFTNVASAPL